MIKKSLLFIVFLTAAFKLHAAKEPFSILLSWQKDPTTTITITWVTNREDKDNLILYRREGTEIWNRASGFHYLMPEDEPYFIHRLELEGLAPNQGYEFKFASYDNVHKFRTIPDDLNQEIRFVVGGDMYHDSIELLSETNQAAAKQDPHFALIGGDIAYAHGSKAQAKTADKERWYDWIRLWTKDMITKDGYIIPVLPAIGNHDVSGRYDQTPKQSPYYYALFAAPGIQGYNVLDFGTKMSVFLLDSGHTHPINGAQANWLHQALQQRQYVPYKFATYHVPAYPSVRSFKGARNKEIRKHWVPIFEQFDLSAAFENHEHAYKRSPPIYQNKIDTKKGVLYIGDGAWGASKPRPTKNPKKTWYLDKAASIRHFILVKINQDQVLYSAIDSNGTIFDETIQYGPLQHPVKEPVF